MRPFCTKPLNYGAIVLAAHCVIFYKVINQVLPMPICSCYVARLKHKNFPTETLNCF